MNCCNNMGAGDQVSHGNRQNLWCFTLNNQSYVTPKWREQRTQQQQWKTEVPTYRHSQQKYYRNLSNFWHLLNARLTVFDRKKFTRTEPQQRKKASNRLSRNSIRHVKKKGYLDTLEYPHCLAPLSQGWMRRGQAESGGDGSSEPWSGGRAGDINQQRARSARRRGLLHSCSSAARRTNTMNDNVLDLNQEVELWNQR